jgi:hypothetical protein
MAEDTPEKAATPPNPDQTALELMKFIVETTGYGKGTSTAGFHAKGPRSSEEYADSLFELFDRCRAAVRKEPGK